MIEANSPSRRALDAELARMLGMPPEGFERVHVATLEKVDEAMLRVAAVAAIEIGHSFVLAQVPSLWDLDLDLFVDCVTATEDGARVRRGLRLWRPATSGAGRLLSSTDAFNVGEEGIVPADLPLGEETTSDPGELRAKTLLAMAVAPYLGGLA